MSFSKQIALKLENGLLGLCRPPSSLRVFLVVLVCASCTLSVRASNSMSRGANKIPKVSDDIKRKFREFLSKIQLEVRGRQSLNPDNESWIGIYKVKDSEPITEQDNIIQCEAKRTIFYKTRYVNAKLNIMKKTLRFQVDFGGLFVEKPLLDWDLRTTSPLVEDLATDRTNDKVLQRAEGATLHVTFTGSKEQNDLLVLYRALRHEQVDHQHDGFERQNREAEEQTARLRKGKKRTDKSGSKKHTDKSGSKKRADKSGSSRKQSDTSSEKDKSTSNDKSLFRLDSPVMWVGVVVVSAAIFIIVLVVACCVCRAPKSSPRKHRHHHRHSIQRRGSNELREMARVLRGQRQVLEEEA
jgi:hypothetical protein